MTYKYETSFLCPTHAKAFTMVLFYLIFVFKEEIKSNGTIYHKIIIVLEAFRTPKQRNNLP